jgi:enoyl-CoA hydratase/carnithine racemase
MMMGRTATKTGSDDGDGQRAPAPSDEQLEEEARAIAARWRRGQERFAIFRSAEQIRADDAAAEMGQRLTRTYGHKGLLPRAEAESLAHLVQAVEEARERAIDEAALHAARVRAGCEIISPDDERRVRTAAWFFQP